MLRPRPRHDKSRKRMKKTLILGLSLTVMVGLTARLQAADKEVKSGAKPAQMAELLKKYDKNGNGKIDDAEEEAIRADRAKAAEAKRAAVQAELLKKYDKNGDGKIDNTEEEAIRADRAKAAEAKRAAGQAELLKKYDKNGDGKIDKTEEEAIRADKLKLKEKPLER
jgi:Ca2+-binding EF-hand superfamily protein